MKGRDAVGQAAGGQKLSAADGDGALQLFATVQEVPLGFIRKGEKLLRPALENHAILGENDVVIAAAKQLHTQLLLQIGDLAGEGGLRHVQLLGGPGEVFFPGDGQKIIQNAEFHGRSHPIFSKSDGQAHSMGQCQPNREVP